MILSRHIPSVWTRVVTVQRTPCHMAARYWSIYLFIYFFLEKNQKKK